jgi:hypothetical protein
VLPDVLRSDAAILPRPPRVDQSAERHSRVGIDDHSALRRKRRNEKGPANFAGPFPVLKPVPV